MGRSGVAGGPLYRFRRRMKNFLFVMRQPPHSGIYVQEQLDMILLTAAFEQPVTLLFLDDGVFQIKNAQNPDALQKKDTAAIFKALELYDVRELYAESESLQERGLTLSDLLLPVNAVRRSEIAAFISGYEVIVGC